MNVLNITTLAQLKAAVEAELPGATVVVGKRGAYSLTIALPGSVGELGYNMECKRVWEIAGYVARDIAGLREQLAAAVAKQEATANANAAAITINTPGYGVADAADAISGDPAALKALTKADRALTATELLALHYARGYSAVYWAMYQIALHDETVAALEGALPRGLARSVTLETMQDARVTLLANLDAATAHENEQRFAAEYRRLAALAA